MKKIIVIGAGFSGLAAASYLGKAGFDVHLVDQHTQAGGRARTWEQDGFRFDMGPSWYWMPDLFARFFSHFGHDVEEMYTLKRLDPSYRMIWEDLEAWDLPAGLDALRALFEQKQPGSGVAFDRFIKETRYIYETATQDYLLRPSLSVMEFFDIRLVAELFKLKMLRSMAGYARKLFPDPRLARLVEWPVLFLGASAQDTSAMYSLMSYADMALGTWYPMGGMHQIIEAMVQVAKEQGVTFHLGQRVRQLCLQGRCVTGVETDDRTYEADAVVAAADYHHVEQALLPPEMRQFSEKQWDRRVMSPSSLLCYLGIKGKLKGLRHHTLFFDQDLDQHMHEVYQQPKWPTAPLFYVCNPSQTDPSVAPPEHENLFLLVPLAAGLEDNEEARQRCVDQVLTRLAQATHAPDLRERIVVRRDYAMRDFVADYNAYKGNAYGMANTLRQTGPFKPPLRSRKADRLYFAGQLTVPGPGMPPSLISGELSARLVQQDLGSTAS